MMKKILFILPLLCLTRTISIFAASNGFNNEASDARSGGNAYAVTARADSPATNWFNPAGLTRLEGSQFSLTGVVEYSGFEFDKPDGQNITSEKGLFLVPSFFYTLNTDSNWAFGLGLNSAYSFSTDWDDPVTDYAATKTRIMPININPNIAYAFSDTFSAAFGLDFSYASVSSEKKLNQTLLNSFLFTSLTGTAAVITSSDGISEFEGTDTALGTNLALLFNPNENWQIGLSYRSKIDLRLNGDATLNNLNGLTSSVFGGSSYKTPASLDISIPATVTAGIAYDLSENTTIELDIEWAQWSVIDQFEFKYKEETDLTRLSILNSGNPAIKDWDDTWNFALGVEYRISEKYTVYGGTRFLPSPIPEKSFDPIVPSTDIFGLHGGLGRIISKNTRIDVYAASIWLLSEDINNNVGNNVGTSIDGKYQGHVLVLGLTYTRKM